LLGDFHSQVRGPPRQRYSTAAMAVVMHYCLIAKALPLDYKAFAAERT